MKPIITLGTETAKYCESHTLVLLPRLRGNTATLVESRGATIATARGENAIEALANLEVELQNRAQFARHDTQPGT